MAAFLATRFAWIQNISLCSVGHVLCSAASQHTQHSCGLEYTLSIVGVHNNVHNIILYTNNKQNNSSSHLIQFISCVHAVVVGTWEFMLVSIFAVYTGKIKL